MMAMAGTTTTTVITASAGCKVNKMTVTTVIVRTCTARFTRPSWNSCCSASMSLVMRVRTRPAFSSV